MSDDRDPAAKRMSFDDMARRAQYEWQRAEEAEAEVRAQAADLSALRAELEEAREALLFRIQQDNGCRLKDGRFNRRGLPIEHKPCPERCGCVLEMEDEIARAHARAGAEPPA